MGNNKLEIMVLVRSQACETASHDKKAFEDALERSKKRIELLESLITLFRWLPYYFLAPQDKSVVCPLVLMLCDEIN